MVGYYHHFGDFARDTVGLTMTQRGIYLQLLHWCYMHECPLPLDLKQVASVMGFNRNERTLTSTFTVLTRYFAQTPEGWMHMRVQREIDRYHASRPKREARKEHQNERARRYRENRSSLFKALRIAGCTMDFNSSMEQLRDMLERMQLPNPCEFTDDLSLPITRDGERDGQQHHAVTEVAQARDITSDNPEPLTHNPLASRMTVTPREAPATPTARARNAFDERCLEALQAVRKAFGGIPGGGNTTDPRLRQLVQLGVSAERFEVAAAQCHASGKGWAYMLAMMKGQLEDAQQGPRNGAHAANVALVMALAPSLAAKPPEPVKRVEDDDELPPIH